MQIKAKLVIQMFKNISDGFSWSQKAKQNEYLSFSMCKANFPTDFLEDNHSNKNVLKTYMYLVQDPCDSAFVEL